VPCRAVQYAPATVTTSPDGESSLSDINVVQNPSLHVPWQTLLQPPQLFESVPNGVSQPSSMLWLQSPKRRTHAAPHRPATRSAQNGVVFAGSGSKTHGPRRQAAPIPQDSTIESSEKHSPLQSKWSGWQSCEQAVAATRTAVTMRRRMPSLTGTARAWPLVLHQPPCPFVLDGSRRTACGGGGKAALTELFQQVKNEKTPVVVERVVAED
jgi:hypothetical protein